MIVRGVNELPTALCVLRYTMEATHIFNLQDNLQELFWAQVDRTSMSSSDLYICIFVLLCACSGKWCFKVVLELAVRPELV